MEETKVLLIEDEKKIADSISKGLKELNYMKQHYGLHSLPVL
jgi:DNA-binding response OmpR family regulator